MSLLSKHGLELTQISAGHDLSSFSTLGDGDYHGTWLRRHALRADSEDLCRVWVVLPKNSNVPLGYFCLSSYSVLCDDVRRRDKYFDPKNGGTAGSYKMHPAVLLGKFALDASCAGKPPFGVLMMYGVFSCFLDSIRFSSARYLVLHTGDDALVQYYRKSMVLNQRYARKRPNNNVRDWSRDSRCTRKNCSGSWRLT